MGHGKAATWLAALMALALVLGPAWPAMAEGAVVGAADAEGGGFSAGDFPRQLTLTQPFTTGTDVRELQALLQEGGYYEGPVDGVFGPVTAKAVTLFQATFGLFVDGVVGPETLEALLARDDSTEAAAKGKAKTRATWTPKPKPEGEDIRLVINTDALTLTVMVDGEPYQQYPVATGRPSLPTPHGDFHIKVKDVWGGGFGARWMQLSIPWGVYGVHGTNNPGSIGSRASHGCVRMYNRHVIELFGWVSVGTPVKIIGRPLKYWGEVPRVIGAGVCGTDVIRLQEALTEMKLYPGPINGRYNSETQKVIRELQKANGLPETGEVDAKTWHLLGY
ncbi:MAG: L,D-transpeptidase family protein [Bacillota bacterium]